MYKKPIIFFDLETTGVDVNVDKIVQIATLKVNVDGTIEKKSLLINPEMPIPKAATDVHGITDEMVEKEQPFSKYAKSMSLYFKGCDLGGFNSDTFDIPLLVEEFKRCDIEFPEKDALKIDVMSLEKALVKFKLADTYKRYMGKDLESAHDASADIQGTFDVFNAQIAKHNLPLDLNEILSIYREHEYADIACKMYIKNGELYWNFGKNKDKCVNENKSYASWFLKDNFPNESKEVLKKYLGIEE
jgi:DNA polymerase-3 subunit epsilon